MNKKKELIHAMIEHFHAKRLIFLVEMYPSRFDKGEFSFIFVFSDLDKEKPPVRYMLFLCIGYFCFVPSFDIFLNPVIFRSKENNLV